MRGLPGAEERFLDLLQQGAAKERVLLSVGKRLEPRDGLDARSQVEAESGCFLARQCQVVVSRQKLDS